MFWNKTVNQLISEFTSVINRLNTRAEYHAKVSADHISQAEQHQAQAKDNLTESVRAAMIATRLGKLVQV